MAMARVQYAFRRAKFPLIYSVGSEMLTAASSSEFQRQVDSLELERGSVLDVLDVSGEGWAFHCDLMILSPLTMRKVWRKIEVIRAFNGSDTARRLCAVYPEAYIPRRSLSRIIGEISALVRMAKPKRGAGRTGSRVAGTGR